MDDVKVKLLGSVDLRFRNPSSFLLAGASMSGKTTFTHNLLRNIDNLFEKPECKHNIIYFYNDEQPVYELFRDEKIVKTWINRLPTSQDFEELTEGFQESGSIFVIDDFQQRLNSDTVQIFTNKCNHRNCVVILLAQNIFCSNKVFREISLNCTYVIMFKNPRDASQINCFAKQIAPGSVPALVTTFRKATKRPHSYLLFDTSQKTPEQQRIRARVLPHESPMILYVREK